MDLVQSALQSRHTRIPGQSLGDGPALGGELVREVGSAEEREEGIGHLVDVVRIRHQAVSPVLAEHIHAVAP